MSHPGGFVRHLGDVLALVLLVLLILIAGFLVVLSATTTTWVLEGDDGQLTQNMGILTIAAPSSWLMLAGGFLGLVLLVVLLRAVWAHGRLLDGRAAVIVLVAVSAAFQVVWVVLANTKLCDWGDVWMISDFATRAVESGLASLNEGPWRSLIHDPRLYFGCYPFQCGLFYYYYWMLLAVGDSWQIAMQLVNVVANEVSALALLGIGYVLLREPRSRRILFVLLATCMPLWWMCDFVYGNAIGMAFGMVFLLLQARALASSGRGRVWCVVISLVPLSVCLVFKSTFVLFAIGALICWVIAALRERSRDGLISLVACLCVMVVSEAVAGLPARAFSADTGIDTSNGMTTLNHLELGLRDDMHEFSTSYDGGTATVSPGGWSAHATDVWEETGGDASAQNAIALDCLADDVTRLTSSPTYFAWFFWSKEASLWSEPTHQAIYYSSMCQRFGGGRFDPVDLSTPTGVLSETCTFLLDGRQLLLYAGALMALVGMWRQLVVARRSERLAGPRAGGLAREGEGPRPALAAVPSEALLLPACFFTGFGCYLLWEAKSVYTFPFSFLLAPVAAYGVAILFSYLDERKVAAGRLSSSTVEPTTKEREG